VDGEPWLSDVGFGGCMLTSPIRIDARGTQSTRFEPVRLVEVGDELRLDALIEDVWRPVCQLNFSVQQDADFAGANWFTSTHPSSPFIQRLIVSRTTPETRCSLVDNRLTVRRRDARAEQRILTAAELEVVLQREFGLPVDPAWRPALARAAGVAS